MNALWAIHIAVTIASALCLLCLCIMTRGARGTDAHKRIWSYTQIFFIITSALAVSVLIRSGFEIFTTLDRIKSL